MISAAATAVGINMTFLFPYTMLRKGWTKEFRGLAIFDLLTGVFLPFILVTGCVVIASASKFHTEVAEGFAVKRDGDRVVAITAPARASSSGSTRLSSLPGTTTKESTRRANRSSWPAPK